MNILLSIIICTFNRQELLKNAVLSLFHQINIDSSSIEIIVIDNNSTDKTKESIIQLQKENKNLYYFLEVQQGLSFARNRGYKEAHGNYIAYLDDDALAPENWIDTALQIMGTYDPDAFGGPIYPFYLNEKPNWFKDEYEIRMHQENTGWLKKENYLSGSNMLFKRDILHEFKGFDTNLGMTGKKIAYGEETELVMRLHNANKKLYYDRKLIVKHLVPEFKQHLSYFIYKQIKQVKSLSAIKTENEFYDPLSSVLQSVEHTEKLIETFCDEYEDKSISENRVIEAVIPLLKDALLHHEKSKHHYAKKRKLRDKILDLNLRKLMAWIK